MGGGKELQLQVQLILDQSQSWNCSLPSPPTPYFCHHLPSHPCSKGYSSLDQGMEYTASNPCLAMQQQWWWQQLWPWPWAQSHSCCHYNRCCVTGQRLEAVCAQCSLPQAGVGLQAELLPYHGKVNGGDTGGGNRPARGSGSRGPGGKGSKGGGGEHRQQGARVRPFDSPTTAWSPASVCAAVVGGDGFKMTL